MKIKKIFKLSSLLIASSFSVSLFIPFNMNKTASLITKNNNLEKSILYGGSSTDKDNEREPTEEEIKEAKKMFWIEFGVTAGFLFLIIICFVTFIIIKKRKK